MEHRITPGRLQIGNFSLYYERVGSGPAMVFLHGLGGNHLSWWQQVPYFMRWFECITLDQRGFGLSPDPENLFNQAHPSDLARLLDYLGSEKAVLVGQSMGGWTMVGYALEHPERVAAMVMADTYGGIVTPAMAQAFQGRTLRPLPEPPPIGSMPTYARDYFARRPEFAFLYDELRILGARPPIDAMARIGGRRYDPAAVRERLKMPVLCLVGEEDELIPPAAIETLLGVIPGARMVAVPDCGHSIYFERPEVFNQLLLDFLRDIGYGSTRGG
ncbi:MAG: alpha/beta hydrolase [Candidatus Binataceae bacterium]